MFIALASVASAQGLDKYKVIAECTDTINRYAHTRDQLDADAHANLFTEDAVFESGGPPAVGRKAIAQRIRDTNPSAMTRHMSGSIVVSIDDKSAITAKSYFHVFQAARPEAPKPVPATSYLFVEYTDQMAMVGGSCKIARRKFELIFAGKS
jgi:hypothetical protein